MAKKKIYDLTEALPLYKCKDGFAVAKDGSITVGFRITLPEVNSLSKGDFITNKGNDLGMNLHPTLEHAIRQLDDGFIFHQQDIFFFEKKELPSADDYLALSSVRMYTEHQSMCNITYFFVTQKYSAFSGDNFESESVKRFVSCIQRFEASLKVLNPKRMDTQDWLFYLESLFSLDFSNRPAKILKDLSFADSKFGTQRLSGYSVVGDAAIEDKLKLFISNHATQEAFKTYNSFVFPVTWGVPCAKIVNNIIYKAGDTVIQNEVDTYASRLSVVFSSLYKSTIEKAEEYSQYVSSGQYIPVYHHFNAFYIYDPKISEVIETQIRTGFAKIKVRATEMSIDMESVFLGSVGGCASSIEYPLQMFPSFLDEALCFSNLEGSYAQNKKGMLLSDKFDNPVYVDVIDEPYRRNLISNWNFLMVGPSGTGKSVMANMLTSSLIANDAMVYMVDTGGSYKIPCLLLGDRAKYIELDPEFKNFSCNPFLLDMVDPDEEDESQYFVTEVDALTSLIFLAWDPNKTLNIEHANSRSMLREFLYKFYRKRFSNRQVYVNFEDVYKFIEEISRTEQIKERFFDIDSFLLVMSAYLPGKSSGALFNGTMNLDDYKHLSFLCFDLEKVAEKSDQFRLLCAILSIMSTRIISSSEHKFKLAAWDEAWRLLSDGIMGEFIKYQFKTIRKKDSGVGIIVQDVPDIINSPFAPAILANSGTKYFLSHEGVEDNIAQYKTQLSLTDADIAKICSMPKSDFGIFIKQGTLSRTFKNKISPEQYAAFTSKKSERKVLEKLIDQYNGNVQMAIDEFVSKGFGISKSKK